MIKVVMEKKGRGEKRRKLILAKARLNAPVNNNNIFTSQTKCKQKFS